LHAWQEEALASWAEHGRIGVIEAVTGTGKSRLGIEAILEARDTMPAVVCVPTLVLVDQWVRNLHRHGIAEVGVVGGGVHDTFKSHRVLVGTVQTLARTPVLLDEPGEALLVADECHRYGAGSFQEALDHRYVRRLGLTATFERSDDAIQDLMTFFGGRPAFEIGYDRAVGDGVVSHYVVATLGVEFAASERTEYDEVASTCSEYRAQLIELGLPPAPFGDFMEAAGAAAKLDSTFLGACAGIYLEAFSRRAEILSDAAAKATAVAALAPSVRGGGGALFFARHVATAEKVEFILRGSGVTAAALHGQSPSRLRRRVLAEFRRRRLQAVAAPQILDEGVDVPDADLAVIVGTTQSRRQMIQRMGRVLRLKPDGRRARFVLLYVRGTSEDPILSGAHEAFFDMISGTADAVQHFSHQEVGALNEFLMSH
jgi:superfamily II DNA or RNA helicase